MTDLTYRSPKTEVRASPIHGRGLFAARPIARGEVVAVKGGYVLTRPEWRALEPTLGAAEIQISENLVIAPTRQDHRDGSPLDAAVVVLHFMTHEVWVIAEVTHRGLLLINLLC